MAEPKPKYDLYFYWAQPERRNWWTEHQFRNLTKDDVTCRYCTYITRSNTMYPKDAFKQHMRKHHPVEYQINYKPLHVIVEDEDDLQLVA